MTTPGPQWSYLGTDDGGGHLWIAPAGHVRAEVEGAAAAFAAAMAPLAEVCRTSAGEWGRLVAAAFEVSQHGPRAETGDPTGDPPIGRDGG